MHRVELKVGYLLKSYPPTQVPNAPCGVERPDEHPPTGLLAHVPNAPCGVESSGISKSLPNH